MRLFFAANIVKFLQILISFDEYLTKFIDFGVGKLGLRSLGLLTHAKVCGEGQS